MGESIFRYCKNPQGDEFLETKSGEKNDGTKLWNCLREKKTIYTVMVGPGVRVWKEKLIR